MTLIQRTPGATTDWQEEQANTVRYPQKVRTVGAVQSTSSDILTKFRNTFLGRFYIGYLKRFIVVRWCCQWVWRNGYPFYARYFQSGFINRKSSRWRPLTKLSFFVQNSGLVTFKLADAALVETPVPTVFPHHDQGYLKSPHAGYTFPEIFVSAINCALVYGGTNLVLAENEVICHDLYDFVRDYTSEELHGRILIDSKRNCIRWLLHDKEPELIPVAATFVDACAANYAHWLTEVLPRIALFCNEDRFRGVPIVVNAGLHKNIMESLFMVVGDDREIILLSLGRALAVDELYLTSVAGYIPFDRRTNRVTGHSQGVFSPYAFQLLRSMFANISENNGENLPEKIFIRRNSGARKVANSVELEAAMLAQDFVIVEPEKLSFLQQVQLFCNAKVILASSGASLANILFTSQDAKIYILIGKQPHTAYWYWQNIACALGKNVTYILGEVKGPVSAGVHADFTIQLDDLPVDLAGNAAKIV